MINPSRQKALFALVSLVFVGLAIAGIIIVDKSRSLATDTPEAIAELFPGYATDTFIFQDQEINVVLADTPAKRVRGLSGTPYLPSGWGMLFVFEETGKHTFWMKDMQYAIDIFWFNEFGKLIYQEKGVEPSTYPESFGGGVESRMVLEVAHI